MRHCWPENSDASMVSCLRPPPVDLGALQLERRYAETPLVRHTLALGNRLGAVHLIPVVQDRRQLLRVAKNADVSQWVAVDDKDVGARAALKCPHLALPAKGGRIVAGRRLDRRHRAHADKVNHQLELPGVPVTVRRYRKTRLRSGQHGDSGLVRAAMNAGQGIELALLDLDVVRIDSDVLAPFDDIGGKGEGGTDR